MPPKHHGSKPISEAVGAAVAAFFDKGSRDGLFLEHPNPPGSRTRDRWRDLFHVDDRIVASITHALHPDVYDVVVGDERESSITLKSGESHPTVYVRDVSVMRKGDGTHRLILTLCPPRSFGQRHTLIFRDADLI